MTKSAIDPCPFCGETWHMDVRGDDGARWVHCWSCGANGPTSTSIGKRRPDKMGEAIAKWNAATPRPAALRAGEGA